MEFKTFSLNEFLTLVTLVDDDERVIAAGVFNSAEDTETAIGFCQAALFNTGTAFPVEAMKDSDIPPTPPNRDELPTLPDVLTKLTNHARQLKKEKQ